MNGINEVVITDLLGNTYRIWYDELTEWWCIDKNGEPFGQENDVPDAVEYVMGEVLDAR